MKFNKSFHETESVPAEGIENAVKLMEAGSLYRYNALALNAGELTEENASEVAKLEQEFADYTGHKYVIAVNSCGSAMFLAMKAAGVNEGDKVFSNAFTFTAVPSAIVHAGGVPVFVETDRHYVIDIDDFNSKIAQNPDAKYFLLSYMRGHIADVDRIKSICDEHGITLIEDCAHSLGTQWTDPESGKTTHIGHHSKAACFSSQSYKMLNSGEGGFVATDDEAIAAYCIVGAGAYEKLYKRHLAGPDDEALFEDMKHHIPNYSIRMSNLTAAVLRPQIHNIDSKVADYRRNYQQLETMLSGIEGVEIPEPVQQVTRVGDSFQFNLLGLSAGKIQQFVKNVAEQGVKVAIFGLGDNARFYRNWRYSFDETPDLSQTEEILSAACDIRLPFTFDSNDIEMIGTILKENIAAIRQA